MPTTVYRGEVQRMLAEGAQVVEVLPAQQYRKAHLVGAINLPWEGEMKQQRQIGDFAKPDVPTYRLHERIGAVRGRVEQAGWDLCVVVNEERVVLGLLTQEALETDAEQSVEGAMNPAPASFRPDTSLKKPNNI